jgi:hypothetical protein
LAKKWPILLSKSFENEFEKEKRNDEDKLLSNFPSPPRVCGEKCFALKRVRSSTDEVPSLSRLFACRSFRSYD